MATTSNIYTLLKFYATKQKSPIIECQEFGDYLHRYSRHHLEENSELSIYCGTDYYDALQAELDQLIANKSIVVAPYRNKDTIFVISFYVEKIAETYKQMESSITIPFPIISDLPKTTPSEIVTRQSAESIIQRLLEKEDISDKFLYGIEFNKSLPSLLYPSTVSMETVLNLAMKKIQNLLHKEESHDYFLKKLCVSNPGKELSIKSFFKQFVENPIKAMETLKTTGDTFFFWSQLCFFLKQDYSKQKDLTTEDVSILQSVAIVELGAHFYKNKTTERLQKESAFKVLDQLMCNPPYYYNMSDIVKMKDSVGVPLLGQYNEQELKDHLLKMTQETIGNQMPVLLIFKISETEGYYIRKEKVMPLVIRLCNDFRIQIKDSIARLWYKYLLEYETLPEMKESAAFERCLEHEVKSVCPILYSLLNASFLPVISLEDNTPGRMALFRNGILIPYSELLMLSRQEIYTDAKIKLPFWYSLPIISWILSLILKKPKKKKSSVKKFTEKEASITKDYIKEQKILEEEKFNKKNNEDAFDPKLSRKRELRKAAVTIESQFVPENSTLDRELAGYMHEWNDRIGKENFDNLSEDVNSLIKDHLRKILRTLKTESFTAERISSLAQSLVDTPSLMKIKNHVALKRYIELYFVKLVKNLP